MQSICDIQTITSGPDGHNHGYPTCGTWRRDGRSVFVEGWGNGLWRLLRVDIETREPTVVAEMPGDAGGYGFDYAPGADCIAYLDPACRRIYLANLETGESREVWYEPDGVIGGPLAISRCGTRIAYWAMLPSVENRYFDSYVTAIFALDVDPGSCELVRPPWVVEAYPRRKGDGYTIHVNHPQINPIDRDHICYSHEMHGATPDGSAAMCRLWHVRADGDNNRYLVRQPAGLHFTHEVISPDGRSLIFPYMHGVGQVDFDTLEARSLYYNPDCCPGHLTVSPDQKWIAGDTWGDWTDDRGRRVQSIMMLEVESRRCAHLCWMPRSSGHPTHPHPNFSPDGTKIALTHLVDGVPQVGYIDVGEVMARWSDIAREVGMEASPQWREGVGA